MAAGGTYHRLAVQKGMEVEPKPSWDDEAVFNSVFIENGVKEAAGNARVCPWVRPWENGVLGSEDTVR